MADLEGVTLHTPSLPFSMPGPSSQLLTRVGPLSPDLTPSVNAAFSAILITNLVTLKVPNLIEFEDIWVSRDKSLPALP